MRGIARGDAHLPVQRRLHQSRRPRRKPQQRPRAHHHALQAQLHRVQPADQPDAPQPRRGEGERARQRVGRARRRADDGELGDREVGEQRLHVLRPVQDAPVRLEGGLSHARPVRGDDAHAVGAGGLVEDGRLMPRAWEAVEVEDGRRGVGLAVDGVGERAAAGEAQGVRVGGHGACWRRPPRPPAVFEQRRTRARVAAAPARNTACVQSLHRGMVFAPVFRRRASRSGSACERRCKKAAAITHLRCCFTCCTQAETQSWPGNETDPIRGGVCLLRISCQRVVPRCRVPRK